MESSNTLLRPDKTIQKILISTTSRLIGEYENESILITHAWKPLSTSEGFIRQEENPASRSAFVVAFRTESSTDNAGIGLPDHLPVGDLICSYLSVLYGKRFDYHGLTEDGGFYYTPDLSLYNRICNHRLPFNSHQKRKCFSIPLNLTLFSILEKLFTDPGIDRKFLSILQAACKFYLQALQNAEREPEVAYLHLITVGEILTEYFEYDKADLLDEVTLSNLEAIKNGLKNGEKIANQISAQLLLIKRRFVKSLCSLVDTQFFEYRESDYPYGYFKADDFEQHISAAYDLRSKYVHTGVSFGNFIRPTNRGEDIQIGKTVIDDKKYAKILDRTPTFLGLERVMRYCLLKFISKNGIDIPREIPDSTQ